MTVFDECAMHIRAAAEGVTNWVSNLSNAAALIWEYVPDINWAGFYVMQNGRLELGPFQGKVACTAIEVGKGVCGTAVQENATQVVADVHAFSGHIACDSASNAEIVIPLHKTGAVWGVLDIDSTTFSRFGEEERAGLEQLAALLEEIISR